MKKLMIMACAAVVAAVGYGETISLVLTKNCTLEEALAEYNAAQTPATAYTTASNGSSLGDNDIEVSGGYKLSNTANLSSWTGDLIIKSGAIVYAESDNTTYATVLGAKVSGTTTNGVVRVEDGATLQLRTNSGGHSRRLARPIFVTGKGVNNQGALQLSSTNDTYALYPSYIHLNGDTLMTRLGSDSNINGGTVWNGGYLFMNNHVLTVGKADAAFWVFFNDVNVRAGGTSAGMIVKDNCQFWFRPNSTWDGDANNYIKATDTATIYVQSDFGMTSGWSLYWDTTSNLANNSNKEKTRDDIAHARCWRGPVYLNKSMWSGDGNDYEVQIGLRGKVSGSGSIGICKGSTTYLGTQWFHLYSGENDFTGGIGITNYVLRLGSPTAVPSGEGKGAMRLQNAWIDLNYQREVGDFVFPETTFNGAGKLFSMINTNGLYAHKGKFTKLTKTGSGTFEIDARMTGGAIDVKGGTVKLCNPLLRCDGLWFGQMSDWTSGNAFTTGDTTKKTTTVYSNNTETALTIFAHPHGEFGDSTWENAFYHKISIYNGWLWNNTGAAKTIKVYCTLDAYTRLTINDTLYAASVSGAYIHPSTPQNPRGEWTITLQPGANYFDVRVYDRMGASSSTSTKYSFGNICTNGLSNWDDQHGLVWSDKTLSKDMNDYHRFEDAGYGLEFHKLGDGFHQLDAITGSGTLDLDGGTLKVNSIDTMKFPKIVNGQLELVNTITDGTQPIDLSGVSSVKFDITPATSKRRAQTAGLYFGSSGEIRHYENVFSSSKTYPGSELTDKEFTTTYTLTNNTGTTFELSPSLYYRALKDWNTVYKFQTWDGWIWNGASTAKTYRVVNTANVHTRLQIGDTMVWNGQSQALAARVSPWDSASGCSYYPAMATITLPPGASHFTLKMFDQFGADTFLRGNVRTNGLENWDWQSGLMRSVKTTSVNLDDYEPFIDSGDGSLFTRELVGIPYVKSAGAAVDLNDKETTTGMLIGDIKASNGSLVVDGVWNLTAAEVEDDVASTRLQFNASSRIVITDATMAEIYDDMSAAGAHGYVLATDVVGNVKPKLVSAVGDKRMSLVLKDGTLTLMPGLGTLIIAK